MADGGFFIAWRVITFLLVFLGFLALASTGEVNLFIKLLFVPIWAGAFFTVRHPHFWQGWMTRGLVWLCLLLIGTVAIQGKFNAVLYLMFFLTLYKCYTLHEPIDHLHALIMSFFMFLACSVITASATYMIFMFCFIILMMLDMVCLTIAREGARVYPGFGSGLATRRAAGSGGSLPVWRRLFLSSLVVGSAVLMLTIVFFLSLPHYSANRLPSPFARPPEEKKTVSGFSEDLNFANINHLQLDDTEVMRVFPAWEDGSARPFPGTLRLRGQALDYYDEKHWTIFPRQQSWDSSQWDQFHFEPLPAGAGPVLIQQIRGQKIDSARRLFGASMAEYYDIDRSRHRFRNNPEGYRRAGFLEPYRLHLDWQTQSIQIVPLTGWGYTAPEVMYQVKSPLAEEAMPFMLACVQAEKETARAGKIAQEVPQPNYNGTNKDWVPLPDPRLKMSGEELKINTALPDSRLTAKFREISGKVAGGAGVADKIVELNKWFTGNFEYSLNPSTPRRMHPLEAFLTLTHKGHCEYFASAFVLLLRAQGIPARVATGFFTPELIKNEGGEWCYVVRQSDAHAWAEVWMNGYGWFTLDPTPPDMRGRISRLRQDISTWARLIEGIKATWQRYVLDYSESQQKQLLTMFSEHKFGRALSMALTSALDTAKSLLLLKGNGAELTNREIKTRIVLSMIAALLLVLLVVRFFSRARQRGDALALRSSVSFMNQLIQRLSLLGWKRPLSQTPAEWFSEIERQTQGRWELLWFLELYHRCRFAGEIPSTDEESRIREILRQIH